jgi:nucleoside-diphosphate-sugar epimerase
MRSVLLFGASGFLGGHVRTALAGDPRVARVDCPGRDRCDLLTADAADLAAVLGATGADTVVNCTGRLDGTAADLVLANTMVTAKLIDAVARADPGIRLVRLGSAGEYGRLPHGAAATEAGPTAPVSDYGVSHLAATTLLDVAARQGRVDGVTLRVFNPVGTGQRGANLLGRAVERIATAVATGADSVTMGPLSAYRDFVDARDVAGAVVAAVVAGDLPVRVVNVGSGRAVSARHAVRLIARAAGFDGEIREEGAGSARSSGVDWMLADIGRARDVLGWRPTRDLADTVAAIWSEAGSTVPPECGRLTAGSAALRPLAAGDPHAAR